jgi:flavin reductase (DIM6/NTAB) family NADH-FMN oxidoreductase RutF
VSTAEVTPNHFAEVMAELPAGVAIVTTQADSGPMGLAVTSLSAYTAEPPSIMVSVAHTSRCHGHLVNAERFGVHLLQSGQDLVAKTFASKADDKFAELDWSWDGGVPRVEDVLVYLRCKRDAVFAHLDHTVIIGVIEELERTDGAEPMLYLRRRFAWRLRGS